MNRSIDLIAYQREPSQSQRRRAGKPRFLRSKDLVRAFSGPSVVLGQNASGVCISKTTLCKGHDNITILLLASEGDPLKIKNTVESIFLSEEAGPVPVGPHELDLRQFADGVFSGSWHVFEAEGFSFVFLVDAGYRIQMTEHNSLITFAKILASLKEGWKCQMQ